MLDIINYLIKLENIAFQLYDKSSHYFKNNDKLSQFLTSIAVDEKWHLHIMENANELLTKKNLKINKEFVLDKNTTESIIHIFDHCLDLLTQKKLTEDILINAIIDSEYSEWNDLFIYIINILIDYMPDFKYIAAKIQNHLTKLEYYIKLLYPENKSIIEKMENIRKIWNYKILIVDDNHSSRSLIESILKKKYITRIAINGKEALTIINNNYFDVLITDINMPEMDGIELYNELVKNKNPIRFKTIFMTASHENISFFKENKLRYILKPFTLHELKKITDEIIFSKLYSKIKKTE